MERPNLYICHTAYQVLVDMVRAMEDAVPPELILSSVIPNTEELAGRLSATGLFRCVRVFDEAACGNAIQQGFLRTLLLQRVMGRRNVEKYYGFSIRPQDYNAIYIHNDWSVLGRYLQDLKAPYILCEDTMASTCRPEHPIIDEQRKRPTSGCGRNSAMAIFTGAITSGSRQWRPSALPKPACSPKSCGRIPSRTGSTG